MLSQSSRKPGPKPRNWACLASHAAMTASLSHGSNPWTQHRACSPCNRISIYHELLAVQEEQEYLQKLREKGGESHANFNGIH